MNPALPTFAMCGDTYAKRNLLLFGNGTMYAYSERAFPLQTGLMYTMYYEDAANMNTVCWSGQIAAIHRTVIPIGSRPRSGATAK